VSRNDSVETPSGLYEHRLKTEETTPLGPAKRESKTYAPRIGIVPESEAKPIKYGFSASK
jgi:hypothetical protein